MSGSGVLKKALPVILGLVIIIAIGAIVTCAKAKEKTTPSVTDAEKIYLSIEEDGFKYEITRGEMYEELKSSVGVSSLINVVNKMILKVEKNSEGKSFFEAVSDEDIIKEIDEAVYGEDGKEELTDEEILEKEEDFLDSMFSSYGLRANDIYGAEIKEHYQLILAKEAYAKAELNKAIELQNSKAEADSDEKPYFTDDKINDYYSDNYYKSYWGIIVPFVTKAEAENALQQLGVIIDTDLDVWCHIKYEEEKDENDKLTGVKVPEAGEALTPGEVVDTFIKLYNMVYGYKSENGPMLSEGKDFKVVDVEAEVKAIKDSAEELVTKVKAGEATSEIVTALENGIKALEDKLAADKYSTAKLTKALESFKTAAQELADNTDTTKAESLKKKATDEAEAVKAAIELVNGKGYIFDTPLEDSPLYYDHERLSGYNSTLPNKFNNTYTTYQPFATESTDGSINKKPSWYTDELVGLSSNSYYVFALKLSEVAIPEKDSVKAEIIEKLTEEELTSNYIETKMAQLRANYSLTIYDEKMESSYATSMESYGVEHESTKEESSDNVAQFTQYTYTKADVSSKKEFKSVRKDNDGIYVYNDGLYEEVKKYNEGETYYTRKEVKTEVLSADSLYADMDKAYGMSLAVSELSYRRFLYNTAFNTYKDMESGKWNDEDKRKEFMEEIEMQRLNFLAGGYTSYGYDPSTMSWKDFMGELYGAKDEKELANSLLYNDLVTEFAGTLNTLVEMNAEKEFVNNYKDLLASDLWALYQEKMNEQLEEYFSVNGIHFLVSRYEDPSNSAGSGTPLDPKEWTQSQKDLAAELIADVILYLQVSKGDYASALTEVVDAFKACPYYVDGEAVEIFDSKGNVIDYTLTNAEVTIDVAKYKSAGLYVKYEDLETFTNGTMVENFNDAAKAIWDKDIADEVYDRVTVLDTPIETEFGYHLYINLGSNKVTTYESNEIKVNEDGTWEYVYVDEEKTEHKTVETTFPQLYEILLYVKDGEKAELSAEAVSAITTYYSPIADEVVGTYYTYVRQYSDIKGLLTDSSLASGANYTKADLERVIDINIESWYENNLKYLVSGDEKIITGKNK